MATLWVVLIVAALAFACGAGIGVRPPDGGKLPPPRPNRPDAARTVAVDRVLVRRAGAVVQRSRASAGARRGRNGPGSAGSWRFTMCTQPPPRRRTRSRRTWARGP